MKSWEERLFFGVWVASAAFFLGMGAYTAYEDQWRITTFRQTLAVVEDIRIERTEQAGKKRFAPAIRYRFEVNGRSYVGTQISAWNSSFQMMSDAQEAVRPYMKGQQVVAFYDPKDPEDTVLRMERSTKPYWMLIIGLILNPFIFPSILFWLGLQRPISPESVTARRRRYRFHVPGWLHPSSSPPFGFLMVRRVLGPLLLLVGLSITAASMVAVLVVAGFELGLFLQLILILLFVGFAWSGYQLHLLGLRAASPEAKQLLASDPRPPILYLRSFEDDDSSAEDAFRLSMFRLLLGSTDEDRLTRALSQLGPVIAIGRPGEWLPSAGAARLNVSGTNWREEVDRLCDRARVVVLRVGFTDGFWWEVSRVWQRVARDRILLWFPLTKRLIDLLERDREFAERFRAVCGIDVSARHGLFVYFSPEGVPIIPAAPPPGDSTTTDRAIVQQLEPFARSIGVSLRIPSAVSAARIVGLLIVAPLVVAIGLMTFWFMIQTLAHVASLWRR
jgi:hypothetical protein